MHKIIVLLMVWSITLSSCNQNTTFDRYTSLPSGWPQGQPVSYQFDIGDTIQNHNLFLKIRTTEAYPFSNLFLLVDMQYPDGQIQKDTLEFLMANPDGSMLGQGYTTTKEHKLWYRGHQDAFVFPQIGAYTIAISHANRELGQDKGVELLNGVIDVGFSIEKN